MTRAELIRLSRKLASAANKFGEAWGETSGLLEANHEMVQLNVDVVNMVNGHVTDENSWLPGMALV
jgi:hypothetical protein